MNRKLSDTPIISPRPQRITEIIAAETMIDQLEKTKIKFSWGPKRKEYKYRLETIDESK